MPSDNEPDKTSSQEPPADGAKHRVAHACSGFYFWGNRGSDWSYAMGRRVGGWHSARLAELPLATPRRKHARPFIKGPSWIGKASSSHRNLLLDAFPLRLD